MPTPTWPGLPDDRLLSGLARLTATHRGRFSAETVHRLLANSYDRLATGATVRTHLVVLAERLTAERLDALAHTTTQPAAARAPRVLFVCTGNAVRSQLAAALLAHHSGGTVQAHSAGTHPAADLDPHIAAVLAEQGIDVPGAWPKPLTGEVLEAADVVVTMGCGDACPLIDSRRYLDWPVADPHGAPIETVRVIRDRIDTHVRALVSELAPVT